ncbi:MAG: hypothetical protein V1843_00055 [bacterium]
MLNKFGSMLLLLVFLSGMIAINAAIAPTPGYAKALPKLTFDVPNSKYRKIDKTGKTVEKELSGWGIPGIGIGNIIMSSNPLPFKKEGEYQNVNTSFTFDEIKNCFEARAYYAGRVSDIIKYVEAKYPGYTFAKKYQSMFWYPPDNNQRASTVTAIVDDESMKWDQNRYVMLPVGEDSDFSSQDLGTIPEFGAGENTIQIHVFLTFKTGTKWVTRDEGDSVVTREEPTLKDFLIAYGECKIQN